jgi:hypothetical protein
MKLPKNEKARYTLFEYTNFNGDKVISAIHFYDLLTFLAEHPEAKRVR